MSILRDLVETRNNIPSNVHLQRSSNMPRLSKKPLLLAVIIVGCVLNMAHAQTGQGSTALLVFSGTTAGTPTATNLSSATANTSNMAGTWSLNTTATTSPFAYDLASAKAFLSSIKLSGGGTYAGSTTFGLDFTTGTPGYWSFQPASPPTSDNWSYGQWVQTTLPQTDTEGNFYSMTTIAGFTSVPDWVDIAIAPSGSALLPECEVATAGASVGDNPITDVNGSQIVMSTSTWYVFMTHYYEGSNMMQCMVLDATGQLIGVGGTAPYTTAQAPDVFDFGPSGGETESATPSNIYMGSSVMDAAGDWPVPGFSAKAAAPIYNNGSGTYLNSVLVNIYDITPNALGAQNSLIKYCVDQTNTCTPSTAYSAPLTITTTEYLRSMASGTGWTNSTVTSAHYTITTPWDGANWVQGYSSLAPGGTGSCYNLLTCVTNTQTSIKGDGIAVLVVWDGATTPAPGVTDNCGTSGGGSNTYTLLASNTLNTYSNDALYYTLVGYGKSCQITATVNTASVTNLAIAGVEVGNVNQTTPIYAGNYALSSQVADPTSSANAVTSGDLEAPTNQPDSFETAMFIGIPTASETISAGTGFTLQNSGWNNTALMDYGVEWGSLPTLGVNTPGTFTVSLGNGYTEAAAVAWQMGNPVTATQSIASTALTQNHAVTSFTPVTGSGGSSPLTYGVSPALPAGLTMSSSTGAITGTPTAVSSTTSYTVTVTDANLLKATASFSLTVNAVVTATQSIASKTLTENALRHPSLR